MNFVSEQAIGMVDSSLEYRAHFNIKDVDPALTLHTSNIPLVVMNGNADKLIRAHHFDDVYNATGGVKLRLVQEGGHNGVRDFSAFESIAGFLSQHLIGRNKMSERLLSIRHALANLPQFLPALRKESRHINWWKESKQHGDWLKEAKPQVITFISTKLTEMSWNQWCASPSFIETYKKGLDEDVSARKLAHSLISVLIREAATSAALKREEDVVSGMSDERNKQVDQDISALLGRGAGRSAS